MVEPTVMLSPHGVDVCVERLCRLAARPAYRVSRRRLVSDISLSDLELNRVQSGRYDISFHACCRQKAMIVGAGSVFLTIRGRLTPREAGTVMSVTVRSGPPFSRRDRVRRRLWSAILTLGLVAAAIAAIATADGRLWALAGGAVLAVALVAVQVRILLRQATCATMALLAGTISAPVADEDMRITLSTQEPPRE